MEKKVETLFAEGFGIAGGWAGTFLGAEVIGAGLVAIFALGPVGAFILILICGTAGGIIGNVVGKEIGSAVYDIGSQVDLSRFYHSPEQVIESIQ